VTQGAADSVQAIGSSPNAVRMQKVVSFYEKLPRGPAPETEAKGLLGRYQSKYMGKNPSGRREWPQPAPRSRGGAQASRTREADTNQASTAPCNWLPDRPGLRTELLLPPA